MLDRLIGSALIHLFMWSGTKLFPYVDLYAPDGEDEPVKGITFCASEQAWEDMRDYHNLKQAWGKFHGPNRKGAK